MNLHELVDRHLCVVEGVVSSWPADLQKTAALAVSFQVGTETLLTRVFSTTVL